MVKDKTHYEQVPLKTVIEMIEAQGRRKEGSMSIKVLLADDNDIVRAPIVRLLKHEPRIELVGEAASFAETLKMTAALQPDILLIDIHMDDERQYPPASMSSELWQCAKRIVAMSVWNDEETKNLAASMGASTLLYKMDLAQELVPTILKLALPNDDGARMSSTAS